MTTIQIALAFAYLPMAVVVYVALTNPLRNDHQGRREYSWWTAVVAALLWPVVFALGCLMSLGRRR